jgi:eukaryotic-like serine/threonine-protein kinase
MQALLPIGDLPGLALNSSPLVSLRASAVQELGLLAAVEFQKILAHRGVVIADPIGALARLQLGRAYALSGRREQSKVAYRDFLLLWQHADPDIPIFKQAKAEFAKLQ